MGVLSSDMDLVLDMVLSLDMELVLDMVLSSDMDLVLDMELVLVMALLSDMELVSGTGLPTLVRKVTFYEILFILGHIYSHEHQRLKYRRSNFHTLLFKQNTSLPFILIKIWVLNTNVIVPWWPHPEYSV